MHFKPVKRLTLVTLVFIFLSACTPDADVEQQKLEDTSAQQGDNPVPSTMAENVRVLPESVSFGGQPRRLWVYLPPGYASSETRYDVVYMHDGQNVFDAKTSYAGEWHVDETLNRLAQEGRTVPIVVAIDNGGDARMLELSPWTNPDYGKALGDAYLNFIIDDVKPLIDKRYRTRPGVMSTAIMGSSMGGLMSHYALVTRPDVFSKAAVFSPSFWYSENAFYVSEQNPLPETHKLYMVVGQDEDRQMLDAMQSMAALHLAQQHPESQLASQVVAGQSHNEAFWQSQVADALLWLSVVK